MMDDVLWWWVHFLRWGQIVRWQMAVPIYEIDLSLYKSRYKYPHNFEHTERKLICNYLVYASIKPKHKNPNDENRLTVKKTVQRQGTVLFCCSLFEKNNVSLITLRNMRKFLQEKPYYKKQTTNIST